MAPEPPAPFNEQAAARLGLPSHLTTSEVSTFFDDYDDAEGGTAETDTFASPPPRSPTASASPSSSSPTSPSSPNSHSHLRSSVLAPSPPRGNFSTATSEPPSNVTPRGMSLSGKVILVTGAGSGVGRACALHIARITARSNPARLFLADLSPTGLRETLALLPREAVAYCTTFDVADPAACRRFVLDAVKKERRIDGAILCAGINPAAIPLADTPDEYFQTVMNVNVFGTWSVIKAIASLPLSQTPNPSVVTVASALGAEGRREMSPYCASKSAVVGITKSLAKELGPRGIRVNAIAPGYINSTAHAGTSASEDGLMDMISETPLGRIGTPDEVASTAAFLLSTDSSFVSGSVLEVHGGL